MQLQADVVPLALLFEVAVGFEGGEVLVNGALRQAELRDEFRERRAVLALDVLDELERLLGRFHPAMSVIR